MQELRFLPTIMASLCIRMVFTFFKVFYPVQKDRVTFASYRSNVLKDNLKAVYEEWKNQKEDVQAVFLLKPYRSGWLGKWDYLFHMLRACYYLATSRYFVIDDFYFPVYVVTPRKGTDIVQLWHAAGAFKKFGYSTVNKSFGPSEAYLKHVKVHSNYSFVMVSCQEIVPFYAEAFNMSPNRIFPLGVPRTDYFYNQQALSKLKQSFYKAYPNLIAKRLILFAPTFRGGSHDQGVFDCPMDLNQMKDQLGDRYALLIHLHPYMRKGMRLPDNTEGFVYMMDGGYNIEELLSLTDILITDYSSIIFDYSLREKPMAFFAQDLDDYEEERGFYFDYRSFIPGPLFQNTDKLVEWIQSDAFNIEQVKAFKERFFDYTDGHASRRIVRFLLEEAASQRDLRRLRYDSTS
ncbi:CDP-glycerol glycerophosphotransferase family protein [Pullulanibacillus sp. KACC 23026]|uniref:CDP-glycerol glycerophosphotransferase family protein n=1 Tax=Pullulanibacillus sp. KACC 23026 TaxID=3028315 RepID=UPI0023AE73C0|nr:CDP-glycerol glycerophosphotransferase family protein [Pullulanibacillus sp. KACC 23026]WEG13143.1 CDP-glycerol glycerophosphotransferase family protein [Pullulanibacillus sp. KACC 23026]